MLGVGHLTWPERGRKGCAGRVAWGAPRPSLVRWSVSQGGAFPLATPCMGLRRQPQPQPAGPVLSLRMLARNPVRAFPLSFLRASLFGPRICLFGFPPLLSFQSSVLIPIKRNFLKFQCLPQMSNQDHAHSCAVRGPRLEGRKCPVPSLALSLTRHDCGQAARPSELPATHGHCLGLWLSDTETSVPGAEQEPKGTWLPFCPRQPPLLAMCLR